MRSRYEAQTRFASFGPEGQAALESASVVIVGVGALGCASAELLVRAGLGRLSLIDRDIVEVSNLHRQGLFDESDALSGSPKAVAARDRLASLSSRAEITAAVTDLHGENALDSLRGFDLILDGTDNFESRHLLNEASLELGVPWIHAACLGSEALAWAIVPGQTACYACLVPAPPEPGRGRSCASHGILPPAVQVAASIQVSEALKLLAGKGAELLPGPFSMDVWTGRSGRVEAVRDPGCKTCAERGRSWLGRPREGDVISCGRDAVQISPSNRDLEVDLEGLSLRLSGEVDARLNAYLLRIPAGEQELTVFRDGRVLVTGTRDVSQARGLVARYVGT